MELKRKQNITQIFKLIKKHSYIPSYVYALPALLSCYDLLWSALFMFPFDFSGCQNIIAELELLAKRLYGQRSVGGPSTGPVKEACSLQVGRKSPLTLMCRCHCRLQACTSSEYDSHKHPHPVTSHSSLSDRIAHTPMRETGPSLTWPLEEEAAAAAFSSGGGSSSFLEASSCARISLGILLGRGSLDSIRRFFIFALFLKKIICRMIRSSSALSYFWEPHNVKGSSWACCSWWQQMRITRWRTAISSKESGANWPVMVAVTKIWLSVCLLLEKSPGGCAHLGSVFLKHLYIFQKWFNHAARNMRNATCIFPREYPE